jgi:hypothetical protein
MEAQKGCEARKQKKVIIRIMIPVFCQFHTVGVEAEIMRMMFPDLRQCHFVLPVIYFMEWMHRKDVK